MSPGWVIYSPSAISSQIKYTGPPRPRGRPRKNDNPSEAVVRSRRFHAARAQRYRLRKLLRAPAKTPPSPKSVQRGSAVQDLKADPSIFVPPGTSRDPPSATPSIYSIPSAGDRSFNPHIVYRNVSVSSRDRLFGPHTAYSVAGTRESFLEPLKASPSVRSLSLAAQTEDSLFQVGLHPDSFRRTSQSDTPKSSTTIGRPPSLPVRLTGLELSPPTGSRATEIGYVPSNPQPPRRAESELRLESQNENPTTSRFPPGFVLHAEEEGSDLQFMVEKLSTLLRRPAPGCTATEHRDHLNHHLASTSPNNHYRLTEAFEANFASVLADPGLPSAQILTNAGCVASDQLKAALCGRSPGEGPTEVKNICLYKEEI